jgi:hypothetical protein
LADLINDYFKMIQTKKRSEDNEKNISYVLDIFDTDDDTSAPSVTDKKADQDVNADQHPNITSADQHADGANSDLREARFRKFVDEEFIKSRQVALESMRKGIRLNGAFLKYFFCIFLVCLTRFVFLLATSMPKKDLFRARTSFLFYQYKK